MNGCRSIEDLALCFGDALSRESRDASSMATLAGRAARWTGMVLRGCTVCMAAAVSKMRRRTSSRTSVACLRATLARSVLPSIPTASSRCLSSMTFSVDCVTRASPRARSTSVRPIALQPQKRNMSESTVLHCQSWSAIILPRHNDTFQSRLDLARSVVSFDRGLCSSCCSALCFDLSSL